MSRRPESPRARRVADRVVMELGEILTTKVEDPRLRRLTVTGARISRDLSAALVWVAGPISPGEEDDLRTALEHATPYFRSLLAPRLGLRVVPSIKFLIDRSIETGARIDELLRDISESEED